MYCCHCVNTLTINKKREAVRPFSCVSLWHTTYNYWRSLTYNFLLIFYKPMVHPMKEVSLVQIFQKENKKTIQKQKQTPRESTYISVNDKLICFFCFLNDCIFEYAQSVEFRTRKKQSQSRKQYQEDLLVPFCALRVYQVICSLYFTWSLT